MTKTQQNVNNLMFCSL